MQSHIQQFIEYLALERHYSQNTQTSYARDLSKLADFVQAKGLIDWSEVTTELLNQWVMSMRHQGISPRSIRRCLSAVRGLFNHLVTHQVIQHNCALGVKTPKPGQKLPDVLDYEQVALLLKPRSNTWQEVRDVALLEVLYSAGLRVSELVGLNVSDVDFNQGFVKVLGKGGKVRHVPLGESALSALSSYLQQCPVNQAVFVSKTQTRLSTRSVQAMVKKRAEVLGIPVAVHPHLLRHAAATHFLQSSHDLRSTQELLGHRSIKSTQVYTHLDFLELSKVYDQHHPRAKK